MSEQLTKQDKDLQRLDAAADSAMGLFGKATKLSDAVKLASGINELHMALTPEIFKELTRFQDTPIGFLTDKDPAKNDRNGKPNVPYTEKVVRRCLVEALLRGVQVVGNHFNIIQYRTYIAKDGFRYLIDNKVVGVTDYKELIGVPRTKDTEALVRVKASWKKHGNPDMLECEIPIKVNKMMGADAIIGKAERKLRRRVYDQMSGKITPDGEVSDALSISDQAKPTGEGTQDQRPDPESTGEKFKNFYDVMIDNKEGFKAHLAEHGIVDKGKSIFSMLDGNKEQILDNQEKYTELFGAKEAS